MVKNLFHFWILCTRVLRPQCVRQRVGLCLLAHRPTLAPQSHCVCQRVGLCLQAHRPSLAPRPQCVGQMVRPCLLGSTTMVDAKAIENEYQWSQFVVLLTRSTQKEIKPDNFIIY